MSITVTVLFPTQPDQSDAFFDLLVSALPETRAYDGCIVVTAHRDLDDPSQVLLLEQWESREHHAAYMQWRTETGLIDAIGPMLAGAPITSFFTPALG